MKDITFRSVIIVLFIALCAYLLYPTLKDYLNTKSLSQSMTKKEQDLKKQYKDISREELSKRLAAYEDSIKLSDPSYKSARANRIKLGLDLQGGMRIVLEVNTTKLLEKLATNPDSTFKTILKSAADEAAVSDEAVVDIVIRKMKERNISLSRYFGTRRDDDAKIIDNLKTNTEDAVNRAVEIIRNRVDQYGVSEPTIQRSRDRRVVVELPGVARQEEARQLLQGTAMLEFKMLKDPEYTGKLRERIDNLIAGKTTTDTTKKDSASAKKDSLLAKKDSSKIKDTGSAKNDQKKLTEEEFKKQHPFIGLFAPGPGGEILISEDQKDAFNKIMNREDVQQILGDDAELLFSAKPIFGDKGKKFLYVYCVKKNAELKGNVVTEARATPSQTGVGNVVNMSMNDEGAIQWARITGANIGKRCAIVLDNMVYSAPVIKNQISGGGSEISGMGDMQEAKLLEIVLKAGALPAPVEIIEERVVGPSLGQDSISKGTNSMIFGYLIIGIFMIFYYQRSGSIAALCLFLTIYFILGILAGFKATLTLPGIAGVVLTMATAVDANVLVFERIREELAVGKTLRAAVDSGYTRAYTAILDSNVTTFITGVVMYQFGTGPIQGFALTLMIGIITSLFSALMIARVIMDYMLNKNYKLTIG